MSGLEELSVARKNPEVTFASESKDRSYGKFGLEREGQSVQLLAVLPYAFPLQHPTKLVGMLEREC